MDENLSTTQNSHSNVVRLDDWRQPLRPITTGPDLFAWAFRRLEEAEPQITLPPQLARGLEILFRAIRAGKCIRFPPVVLEWPVIFTELDWGDIYSQDQPRVGRDLIVF